VACYDQDRTAQAIGPMTGAHLLAKRLKTRSGTGIEQADRRLCTFGRRRDRRVDQ
jgi:hypothetical protein